MEWQFDTLGQKEYEEALREHVKQARSMLYTNIKKACEIVDMLRACLESKKMLSQETELMVANAMVTVFAQSQQYDSALEYINKYLPVAQQRENFDAESSMLMSQGLVLTTQGDPAGAMQAYTRALYLRELLGDPVKIGRTCINIGYEYLYVNKLVEADEYFVRAWKLLRDISPDAVVATTALVKVHEMKGDLNLALSYTAESLSLAEKGNDVYRKGLAYQSAGSIHYQLGNNQEALAEYLKALECFEESGQARSIGQLFGGIGDVYYALNVLPKAEMYYKRSADLAESQKDHRRYHVLQVRLADITLQTGNSEKASAMVNRALQFAESTDFAVLKVEARDMLARLAMHKNQHEDARPILTENTSLAEENKHLRMQTLLLSCQADFGIGNYADALGYACEALVQAMHSNMDHVGVNAMKKIGACLHKMKHFELSSEALLSATAMQDKHFWKQNVDVIHEMETRYRAGLEVNIKQMDDPSTAESKDTFISQEMRDPLPPTQVVEECYRILANLNKGFTNPEMSAGELFEYSRLADKLKEIAPEISTSEIRVALMLRKGLDTKAIATALSVSFRTVQNYRYALRRYLKLSKDESLDFFFLNF